MTLYEPMVGGRNFYANVDNDSGTENGLSHETGYKNIVTAMNGATFGDILWVHAGLTFQGTDEPAYSAVGGNGFVRNLNIVHNAGDGRGGTMGFKCIGYANGTTLETAYGKDRPLFLHRVTNGSGWIHPTGSDLKNMRLKGWHYSSSTSSAGVLTASQCNIENVQVIGEDLWTGSATGQKGYTVAISGQSLITDCEFIETLSNSNFNTRATGYEGPFSIYETRCKNTIFKIDGDGPWLAFATKRHSYGGGLRLDDCIFIGNGNQVGVTNLNGQAGGGTFTTQSMQSGMNWCDRCIFYNMSVGFKLLIPNTSNTDANGWQGKKGFGFKLNNCIFHSCGTGVLQSSYADPTGFDTAKGAFSMDGIHMVKNCAFYAMTSAQTSGDMTVEDSISLTEDPFIDVANGDFRLNTAEGGGALLHARDIGTGTSDFTNASHSKNLKYEHLNNPVKETTRSI